MDRLGQRKLKEARILDLKKKGCTAPEIINATGIPKTTVYDILSSLGDFHLVDESAREKLLRFLRSRKDKMVLLHELELLLGISKESLSRTLKELQDCGHNIYVFGGFAGITSGEEPAAGSSEEGGKIRFGLLSDNHIGSKAERLDVLYDLFDWYASEGITTVYQVGNIIEGDARFNVRERYVHGIDAQVENLLDKWPKRDGIETRFICGDDHEGWYQQDAGISIGRHIQHMAVDRGRNDLRYLGYLEHDIEFVNNAGSFVFRLMHPKGGSAYALSYSVQKIVQRSLQSGEKPHVLAVGHFHKLEYMPNLRGVHCIQTGCTCDQSVYLRGKGVECHLGGWLIEIDQCPNTGSVKELSARCRTYFDKSFHQNYDRY